MSSNFLKIEKVYQPLFNGLLIPYIDLDTNELCWLVDSTKPEAAEAVEKYEMLKKENKE